MPEILERLQQALAGRYRIERELGAGGMATVYLAHDLKHDRPVALKVLRQELAAAMGPERFHREIQIAAKLQHPNILPLLDSGEAAGLLYYAMPFVEGQSLRVRLDREGALPVGDAVRILRDVVDALTEAHAHGVVHRDIKPENIMLRGRHALVADFGVAKAVSEATGRQTLTTAGVALGTPAYMAPEQASADPHLDHRVDIYAVGAVGYELLTGRPVFMGTTPQMVLSAHVTEAPAPITRYRETVPPALEALLMRCLEKKPADRWQSAEALLPQLEALATPSGGITPTETAPVPAVAGRRRMFVAAAVTAVVALIAVGLIAGQLLRPRPLAITASDFVQLTSEPGVEFEPAISPDGKEVAYAAGPIGTPHVAVRSTANAAGGGEVRLSDTSLRGAYFPKWGPDGQSVRFGGCRAVQAECSWYEAGRYGGAVRPIVLPERTRGNTSVAWSADGSRVVFGVADSIFVFAVADTAGARRIALQPGGSIGLHSFAWSPEGDLIAYVNGNARWQYSGNVAGSSIWIVSSTGGTPRSIATDEHLNVSPTWLDDRHLLFVSNRDGAQRGVYVVEVGPRGARGRPRIIPGIADPHSISYSIVSHRLAWSKFTLRQNIWSYPLGRSAPVSVRDGVRVTTGNEVSEVADVSPDGRWLAFDSNRRGNMDIYKMPLGAGDAVPLTDAPWDEWDPKWSPDGREIAFYADVARSAGVLRSIVVMPAAGGKTALLTNAPAQNSYPSWSPDGRHIAFASTRTGRAEVWLLSRDSAGGRWHPEVRLTDSGGIPQDWVKDGPGILCARGSIRFILSLQGHVTRQWDLAELGVVGRGLTRVSRDGRTFYVVADHRDGRRGLWAVPMSGGPPRLIVASDAAAMDLVSEPFGLTRDRVYLAVSEYESDIWVAKLTY